MANYKGPLLQYSLIKRDQTGAYSPLRVGMSTQPGDAVRLNVSSAVGGHLSLYELDPAGAWKRLYPAAEQGLLVAPNVTESIPEAPIVVSDKDQKLRLMLVPSPDQPLLTKESEVKAKIPVPPQTGPAPLVIDVTIGPKKVP
jgi:hypothetical protein